MMKILDKLRGKPSGAPSVCFVACDFSLETLGNLNETSLLSLARFFEGISPFDNEEIKIWHTFLTTGLVELAREWSLACLYRRGGYLLGIFALEEPSDAALSYLRSQPWVAGMMMTRDKMTDTYVYVLRGLDQYLRARRQINGLSDVWLAATISLGPVPWHDYDANEPMNIATRRAADDGVTVYVAAGNEARLMRGNSLNPWSVAPWVIGVGATSMDGKQLLETCSRGVSGQTYVAPTIVAPGETAASISGLTHEDEVAIENISRSPPGSFTIAPVGGSTYKLRKDEQGRVWIAPIEKGTVGPELPLDQVLDAFKRENASKPKRIRGTSFAAEYVSALGTRLVKHIKLLVPDLAVKDRPKLMKTLLEDMAQPLTGYARWEVGHGLVTSEIADQYLRSLDKTRLMRLRETARQRW